MSDNLSKTYISIRKTQSWNFPGKLFSMEVLASSSLSPNFTKPHKISPNFSIQVKLWVSQPPTILKASNFRYERNRSNKPRSNANPGLVFVCNRYMCLLERNDHRKFSGKVMMKSSVNFRKNVSVALVRLVSVLLVSSISVVTTDSPSYNAIKKMIATLDDPFTRFLEPGKFQSLRSGTQGAVTGVGLSIGYPAASDGSTSGLIVISAAPGGPANRAGVSAGDVILGIDNTTTETLTIYDAAQMLQGPEGSTVELAIRSGPETRFLSLTRERVSVNPVKSRLCEIPGSGSNSPKIGYIKLTTFNQNASAAVKEAIETLRGNNVNAFVLDLRDNSGGSFPEGIEIAKLNKGVIVYICDSRGVRDIYDTDGSNAIATSEPLAVLVNKGTASASEILAGALKDNKRALVYGEPTYGKGKIQSVFQLSDGSGLAVTVARYETPAHTDIDKVGVTPDHPLPKSFPKDEEAFCGCLKDPTAACYLNQGLLFSR
ncbi:unnamed protein product [Thlaspi arvense]|uniref:PDZ domain-containing protein n=1 Tax=Thlaspi arvense TaxID=13288 RepID=A0AAU9T310_THLAR|nr:unnamed protein product [Thlaspi arvense]